MEFDCDPAGDQRVAFLKGLGGSKNYAKRVYIWMAKHPCGFFYRNDKM
jgi:hypothetical protein